MIRVLAIDDEPLALRQLELYISKVPFLELVSLCSSASAANGYISSVDAIFVDINMPGVSGMEFVRSLEDPPLVVFTTAYSEYALEGFKVNAADYLLKPFSFDEFLASAERIRTRLKEKKAAQAAAKASNHIFLKTDYKTVKVELSSIVFVESMSEYVKIHFTGNTPPLVVLYSLKRLCEELPPDVFCRIHRSYIVSLPHISNVNSNSAVLDNGKTLPVSDSYRSLLKTAINR